MGTLRLLVIQPVSRTRLMLVKFSASVIYTPLLLIWMALLAFFLSMWLFGTNDMLIARNTVMEQIRSNDVLWRYIAAFGYATVALSTVAALAFLLSVFAENSIGPIVSTISIVIVLYHPIGNADTDVRQYGQALAVYFAYAGLERIFLFSTDGNGAAIPGYDREPAGHIA